MQTLTLVFLGGGVGSALRYLTVLGIARAGLAKDFPWSIMLANVLGSLAIGYLAALPALRTRDSATWFFLATGVLGGFTTFSTFSLDTLQLLQSGRTFAAAANAFVSIALGVAAAAAGFHLSQSLHA